MRLVATLFLLMSLSLISFSVSSEESTQLPKKSFDWKYVFSHSKDGDLYFDKNSLTIEGVQGSDVFDSGNLLFVYNDPHEIKMANGTTILALSRISVVMIDCKSGILAPVYDFWFDVDTPTRDNKPIARYEFKGEKEDMDNIPKGSPLYRFLCPIYT